MTYWVMRALFIVFFRLFGSWEVSGHGHVPEAGAVLITPNHLSFLDPPLVGCALRRPGWFMAKAELFKIPGLRWLIRGMHAYPVKRGVPDRASLKQTLAYLKNGEIVCVFPEGTRSVTGELGPVEMGIGMLAVKTGAPVVPVGIRGTDRMLPRDAKRLYRAKIRIRFGPVLQLEPPAPGVDERQAYHAAADRIREAIAAVLAEMDAPKADTRPGMLG